MEVTLQCFLQLLSRDKNFRKLIFSAPVMTLIEKCLVLTANR